MNVYFIHTYINAYTLFLFKKKRNTENQNNFILPKLNYFICFIHLGYATKTEKRIFFGFFSEKKGFHGIWTKFHFGRKSEIKSGIFDF
jgi:hypothetical protein